MDWRLMRLCGFLFHLIIFLINAFVLILEEVRFNGDWNRFVATNGESAVKQNVFYAFPYIWKFYTRWGHAMTTLLFGAMVIEDVRHLLCSNFTPSSSRNQSKLSEFCDTFFVTVLFPQSFVISLLFWWMYFIAKEALFIGFQSQLTTTFWIIMHVTHTLPMIAVLTELLLNYHKKPTYVKGLLLGAIPGVIYIVFCTTYGSMTGLWVYPLLQGSYLQKVAFFLQGTLVTLLFYTLARFIHDLRWTDSRANYYMNGPQRQHAD